MADLLDLSRRIIDEGLDEPVNRTTLQLSEIDEGIALVESFSHVVVLDSGDGLVLFDASLRQLGRPVLDAIRGWSVAPVDTLVYTHGHVDHVGGADAILHEAAGRGDRTPAVVAHDAVRTRFRRYDFTNGYNATINDRQFRRTGMVRETEDGRPTFPRRFVEPTVTYRDRMDIRVGGLDIELHHGRGETDDHTWGWIASRRIACVGDFVIWSFPNAGNPQKVQRYPLEWAQVLRQIEAHRPELLVPAHGLPIEGEDRIRRVLDDTASVLESVVMQTIDLMNEGATLDAIVHTVRPPEHLLERPYLRPVYDDPEFIVRNVWRGYGGWYDGNPAHLKPAPEQAVAAEIALLAGGADALAQRALVVADEGDLRLAAHLVELAATAAPEDAAVHEVRAEVYRRRRREETSLMAKSIFGAAERESSEKTGEAPT